MKAILVALMLVLSTSAHANASSAQADGLPWRTVTQQAHKGLVVEFFSFGCGYCMQADQMILSWAKTFPRQFKFEQIPVVFTDDDIKMAMAYYAVQKVAPAKLEEFKSALFLRMTMGQGVRIEQQELLRMVAKARVPMDAYIDALGTDAVRNAVKRAAGMTSEYKIDTTPSMAVGGRYVTHAGYTGGNYETLLQLVAGLMSREMGM